MGICECKLADGSLCQNETVWNDMCSDCNSAYDDLRDNLEMSWEDHPRFYNENKTEELKMRFKIKFEEVQDGGLTVDQINLMRNALSDLKNEPLISLKLVEAILDDIPTEEWRKKGG